jgi:hypothetical protein
MPVNKFNKILSPSTSTGGDSSDNSVNYLVSGDEESILEVGTVTGFLKGMSDEEMADVTFLGKGPHQKVRVPFKISDPIPSRAARATGDDNFFQKTFKVYWNSTLPSAKVYLQAEPIEFSVPVSTMSVDNRVIITVTADNGTVTSGTYTPTGSTRTDITSLFTSTSRYYTINIVLQTTATTGTTVGLAMPLYIIGTAPQDSIWAGVPNISPDGLISYDLTIQMPETVGVEEWELEIAEL